MEEFLVIISEITKPLAALFFAHFLIGMVTSSLVYKAKHHSTEMVGIPWYMPMIGYCYVHAFTVYIILGVWWISILDFIVHFWVDYQINKGEYTYAQGHSMILISKIVWIALLVISVNIG